MLEKKKTTISQIEKNSRTSEQRRGEKRNKQQHEQ